MNSGNFADIFSSSSHKIKGVWYPIIGARSYNGDLYIDEEEEQQSAMKELLDPWSSTSEAMQNFLKRKPHRPKSADDDE